MGHRAGPKQTLARSTSEPLVLWKLVGRVPTASGSESPTTYFTSARPSGSAMLPGAEVARATPGNGRRCSRARSASELRPTAFESRMAGTVSLRGINRRSEWRGSPAPCHAGFGPNTGRGWTQPVCPKSGAPDLTWSEQPGSSPTVPRAPREFGSFSRGWAGSGAQLGLGGTKGYPEQTCSPGEPGSSLKNWGTVV